MKIVDTSFKVFGFLRLINNFLYIDQRFAFATQIYLPSQKSKPRFNQEKARFNQDEYNFNDINRDFSEILS